MNPHSRLPCPPTLLIQDLRLHMAFLLFTASHRRRWPAGHGGRGTHAVKVLIPLQRLLPQSYIHIYIYIFRFQYRYG